MFNFKRTNAEFLMFDVKREKLCGAKPFKQQVSDSFGLSISQLHDNNQNCTVNESELNDEADSSKEHNQLDSEAENLNYELEDSASFDNVKLEYQSPVDELPNTSNLIKSPHAESAVRLNVNFFLLKR